MEAKHRKIIRELKKLLIEKGQFEKVDLNLINEIAYSYFIADQAKEAIAEHGILVNVRNEGLPLYQTNQAVSIYQNAIKTINTMMSKLGITVQERNKLKFVTKEAGDDGFDD